ncbi:probable E3 ubiquitin-protein ligase rnf217 [Phtheirospermum japonicum]|uniref:RBR-type E3 ubiquitin transferase n=1 Tax=Phtheirospermum japonicum TaxID=374723 RepID=A0A830B4Y0_9LAMI|nr:probable E3 ubiquitin-protein ligase rnf217 [Phtheirospermum japonicum]
METAPLTFLCEICTDEKPKDEIFGVLGCRHSYCSECMEKYVASKLQDNVIAIGCPVSGCKGFLEPQHCISILPKQVFDRWGDALCETVILATQKFYCPFKDCSALLVDDKNEVIAESECPDCNRLFCAQCKVPWHSGIDCAEFRKLNKDERSSEDIMLMNLAKGKRWVRCPSCRIYIEKTMGCAYMLCRLI